MVENAAAFGFCVQIPADVLKLLKATEGLFVDNDSNHGDEYEAEEVDADASRQTPAVDRRTFLSMRTAKQSHLRPPESVTTVSTSHSPSKSSRTTGVDVDFNLLGSLPKEIDSIQTIRDYLLRSGVGAQNQPQQGVSPTTRQQHQTLNAPSYFVDQSMRRPALNPRFMTASMDDVGPEPLPAQPRMFTEPIQPDHPTTQLGYSVNAGTLGSRLPAPPGNLDAPVPAQRFPTQLASSSASQMLRNCMPVPPPLPQAQVQQRMLTLEAKQPPELPFMMPRGITWDGSEELGTYWRKSVMMQAEVSTRPTVQAQQPLRVQGRSRTEPRTESEKRPEAPGQKQQRMNTTPATASRSGTLTKQQPVKRQPMKPMQMLVAEVQTPPPSDDEMELDEPAEDEDDIVIGPTAFAVLPMTFEDVWLSDGGDGRIQVTSNTRLISCKDIARLSDANSGQAPLSFGSLLHVCGHGSHCRPCMFERIPGRCRKVWLCDFCHLHSGRKRRVTEVPILQ